MKRLTRPEAREILARCDINTQSDYHALRSSKVDALLAEADKRGYRKGRDANGSRARMFHEYVQRATMSQFQQASHPHRERS